MRTYPIRPAISCLLCGTSFIPKTKRQRYCSYQCSGHVNALKAILPPAERFWPKVDKSGECWIWTGCVDKKSGYGKFGIGGREAGCIPAHRFSWESVHGPIPDDMCICHDCDKNYPVGDRSYRRCVRPSHLFLGTKKDNTQDALVKGRLSIGEEHPPAKLTETDVLAIRARAHENQYDLASEFGVCQAQVNRIIKRQRWKHLG